MLNNLKNKQSDIFRMKCRMNLLKGVNDVTFFINCVMHSYFKDLTFVKRKVIDILKQNKNENNKINYS